MNSTNATSSSHICVAIWFGYKESNDKSTGPLSNASDSAAATASHSGGGIGSTTSVGGDNGASSTSDTTGGSGASGAWIGET